MNWQSCQLGDVITLKRGHDLPGSRRKPGDVPVVSSAGITGCHNMAKASAPGVITGRYGTLGEVYYLEQDYWPLNTALYVIDFKGNHPRFSAYFLKHVLRNHRSDKAAVPGVDRNVLHALKVNVPDHETQGKIVNILATYDDLIDNNLRRIELLEQAGRELYKEWFVRFRFPGHEHVKLVDGLPEAWSKEHLSNLVSTQYGFTASATTESVGPKFLRGTDINKTSYIDWSQVPYCPEEGLDKAKYALVPGDILVIRMADPGKVALVEEPVDAIFASYLVRLKLISDEITPTYLFFVLSDREYQSFISGASGGSTRKSASAKLLTEFSVVVPPLEHIASFEERVHPIRSQTAKLLYANANLRKARDLLLPKLMSGEIAV